MAWTSDVARLDVVNSHGAAGSQTRKRCPTRAGWQQACDGWLRPPLRPSSIATPQFLLRSLRLSLRCLCRFIFFNRLRFTEAASIAGSSPSGRGTTTDQAGHRSTAGGLTASPCGSCSGISNSGLFGKAGWKPAAEA